MGNIPESDKEYEELYKTYFKKFFNYGRKFTKDVYLIEDSIQEVFLDIWNKRQRSVEINSLNSYYFSSFRYILFKKIKKAEQTSSFGDQDNEPPFTIEQRIIAGEIADEQFLKVQEGLKALTSRQREAIFLRFYEGLSFEEVATVLNITVKATYKIMARSLATLKDNVTLTISNLILFRALSDF
jgi:RNA polymerase sigma factor (sigma-70 family)